MSASSVARHLVEAVEGEPVAVDDHRVWMIGRALSECRWRGLTEAGLARQAAAGLDVWQTSRMRLDLELARLLEDGG